MAENWVKAGDERQFGDGVRLVRLNGRSVMVARLNGGLYAFDALCAARRRTDGALGNRGHDRLVSAACMAFDRELGGVELHGYRVSRCVT